MQLEGPLAAELQKLVLATWAVQKGEPLASKLSSIVLGPDFGKQLQAMFERDLAASEAITIERWECRPLGDRLKEWWAKVWEH